MNITNAIEQDWIRCDLEAEDPSEAIQNMIAILPEDLQEPAENQLFENGEDGSTVLAKFAVGRGVAFPHARSDQIDGVRVAMGIFPDGVSFNSGSEEPVRIVVLFLLSEKRSGLYLKLLSAFSKIFKSDVHMQNIVQSRTPESVVSYLNATGIRLLGDISLHDLVDPPDRTLSPNDSVEYALELLVEDTNAPVPVVDEDGNLVGEISNRDIVKASLQDFVYSIAGGNVDDLPRVFSRFIEIHGEELVERLMTPRDRMRTISDESSILEAISRLIEVDRDEAFVVSDGKLVGRFSLTECTEKICRPGIV